MEENNVVYLENIDKRFSGVHALKNISLGIKKGEIYCLAGENGCGKSTLIKVISGVYTPDMGKIYINGEYCHKLNPRESISRGIQVIYQDFSLFPNLSVAENISGNRMFKEKRKIAFPSEKYKIAKEALAKIGIDLDLDELVGNLPVADKQLVAIARALTSEESQLIIMDEPTSALTHQEIKRLLEIILRLKEQNIAIIFVSHKLKELMEVCDHFIIMRNGAKIIEGPASGFNERKIASLMIGRDIIPENRKKTDIVSEKVLEVKNISCKGKYEDISFNLRKGEILGITGLLGCGRTEIVTSLFGINPADSGEILIEGKKILIKNPYEALDHGIGYVPEDRLTEGLFLSQSILNNTIVSSLGKISNKLGVLNSKKAVKIVTEKITELKLNTTDIKVPAKNLSGGNQQRVVIAKWLCTDLKVLILNGPSVGVDIGSKFEIHKKIKEIASKGISIIIVSDDIPEIVENCDRVLLIHKGKMNKEFEFKSISEENIMNSLNEIR